MVLILGWAYTRPDPLIANELFLYFLLVVPVLAAAYLLVQHSRSQQSLSFPGLFVYWVGSSGLGFLTAGILFIAFHGVLPEGAERVYNYRHFGFSSYIQGRNRQVQEGGAAVNGVVYDLEGRPRQLSDLWKSRPVVLEFGSITCPIFVGKVPTMNELSSRWREHVDFFVLYTREAHPGSNYGSHRDLEEKLQCAADLRRAEDVGRTILVDDVEGRLHVAYGALPNSVYLIGRDGVVSHRADWADPEYLNGQIELLLVTDGLGATLSPTSLSDNFASVDPNAVSTLLRVFIRAGLGSAADFFLSFPAMMQGRLRGSEEG